MSVQSFVLRRLSKGPATLRGLVNDVQRLQLNNGPLRLHKTLRTLKRQGQLNEFERYTYKLSAPPAASRPLPRNPYWIEPSEWLNGCVVD